MRIAFIGFGEAARAFQVSLLRQDAELGFAAYDVQATPAMTAAMERHGVRKAATPAEAVAGAHWVVSAVTADQSGIAADTAARALGPGQTFIDINSVSPARKRESAAAVDAAGTDYIDMAVMAPVHPRGHRTPVLLAGAIPEAAEATLARLGFDYRVAGGSPGAATAIKMIRSLFVKGLEAITVEALLAADAAGCFDEILDSLSASFAGLGWPEHAHYEFERTLTHGTRRAAEMRESSRTLAELGLHGPLAAEIAAVQEAMGAAGHLDPESTDLRDIAAAVLSRRLGKSPTRTGRPESDEGADPLRRT